jgi:hypothetical protein
VGLGGAAFGLALPVTALADSCPNAVFRSGPSSSLPDCRAYEMVTPPYKEGYAVEVGSSLNYAVAEDGAQVLGASIGTFAGSENDFVEFGGLGMELGADYVFSRGASGWSPLAIEPSAAEYPRGGFLALNSEMTESLWVAGTTAQVEAARIAGAKSPAESFYVRHSNGPLVEVGPVLPPGVSTDELTRGYANVRGVSSSNLSAVLYAMSERHWPGDETEPGAESLYEYVGTGNAAPLLVGVRGGVGSTRLISKCGTQLGSAYLSQYEGHTKRASLHHAVSSNGGTVFFTATECGESPPVQELYARVDNGLPDAHTVEVSEPSKEACPVCDTEAGVLADATFQWASADGSKVFFTTSQPLLGADTSNNLYEYDLEGPAGTGASSGKLVRVSAGDATVTNPTAEVERVLYVSPDGSHVYFTASGVLTRTPNGLGQEAEAGQSNLYLYERDSEYPDGHTVFVLPYADVIETGYLVEGGVDFSQNGLFLAFKSYTRLTPDDLSSGWQGFAYDSQTGAFVRYSVGRDGFNDNGNTSSPTVGDVADDGSVYFDSVDPLVPQAVSGALNVYEYREGNVSLISSGQDTRGTYLDFISPSGDDVFFQTYSQLVPRDADSQEDTYDARVDGGFSEPPPSPLCEGDACQGPLSGAPVLLSPGSEFQAGGENVTVGSPVATEVSSKAVKGAPKAKKKAQRKQYKHKRKARKSSDGRRRADKIGGRQ